MAYRRRMKGFSFLLGLPLERSSLLHLWKWEGRTSKLAESPNRKKPSVGHCLEDKHLEELPNKKPPHTGAIPEVWGVAQQLAWLSAHPTGRDGEEGPLFQTSQIHPRGRGKHLNWRNASQNCNRTAINTKKLLATNNYFSRLWTTSEFVLS